MTKATNAANYIFWLEQLEPTVQETNENREIGPSGYKSMDLERVQFSYPMRPKARVLRGIDLNVSKPCPIPVHFPSADRRDVDNEGSIRCFCWCFRLWQEHHDRHARTIL